MRERRGRQRRQAPAGPRPRGGRTHNHSDDGGDEPDHLHGHCGRRGGGHVGQDPENLLGKRAGRHGIVERSCLSPPKQLPERRVSASHDKAVCEGAMPGGEVATQPQHGRLHHTGPGATCQQAQQLLEGYLVGNGLRRCLRHSSGVRVTTDPALGEDARRAHHRAPRRRATRTAARDGAPVLSRGNPPWPGHWRGCRRQGHLPLG